MGGYRQDVFHGVKGYLEAWSIPSLFSADTRSRVSLSPRQNEEEGVWKLFFVIFLRKMGEWEDQAVSIIQRALRRPAAC